MHVGKQPLDPFIRTGHRRGTGCSECGSCFKVGLSAFGPPITELLLARACAPLGLPYPGSAAADDIMAALNPGRASPVITSVCVHYSCTRAAAAAAYTGRKTPAMSRAVSMVRTRLPASTCTREPSTLVTRPGCQHCRVWL